MSPNSRNNNSNQANQGNGQPFFNPWGMFPSPPPMNTPDGGQKKQQQQQPNQPMQPPMFDPFFQPVQPPKEQRKQPSRQQPKQPPKQQPSEQPYSYNPWHVFPGLRPMIPPEKAPEQPKGPPKQQHEQAPDGVPFNPWSVLPAFGSQIAPQEEKPKKKPVNNTVTLQTIKEHVGKVVGTSIVGYGRINVHIKGVNPNGMVHLVLLNTQQQNDTIYIHNSDMNGIYPPTF